MSENTKTNYFDQLLGARSTQKQVKIHNTRETVIGRQGEKDRKAGREIKKRRRKRRGGRGKREVQ